MESMAALECGDDRTSAILKQVITAAAPRRTQRNTFLGLAVSLRQ
jgi:hypothetical protein